MQPDEDGDRGQEGQECEDEHRRQVSPARGRITGKGCARKLVGIPARDIECAEPFPEKRVQREKHRRPVTADIGGDVADHQRCDGDGDRTRMARTMRSVLDSGRSLGTGITLLRVARLLLILGDSLRFNSSGLFVPAPVLLLSLLLA